MQIESLQYEDIFSKIEGHIGVTLVCFGAVWCKPCQGMDELLRELKSSYGSNLLVFKIDVDLSKEVADKFGIKGVPVCIFYKDGKRIDSLSGSQPKFVFTDTIEELLER